MTKQKDVQKRMRKKDDKKGCTKKKTYKKKCEQKECIYIERETGNPSTVSD